MSEQSQTDNDYEYDISDLPELIQDFRYKLLYDTNEFGLDPIAEQYFLLSMSALEQAQRYAQLSKMAQSKGINNH